MINLRYHIVSLVAVFLALGVGILAGSTVIDQGLVTRLETQTKNLAGSLEALRAQNTELQRQQDLWDSFGRTALVPMIKGRLKGRSGILVFQEGEDTKMLDGIAQMLTDAGATLRGRLGLTGKWALKDDATRQQLALALGVQAATTDVLGVAAGRIAARLGQTAEPGDGDLIHELRDAGFLSFDQAGPGSFPPAGSFIVVVAAGSREARPAQAQFFVPLLAALADGRSIAVIEPLSSPDSLAERVRSDDRLRGEISTVDDGDIVIGRVALVYAIRSLAVAGRAEHFGARRSASGLLPESLTA